MFSVCVVACAVLVTAGAWDVPCSSVTPVNDIPMSQFRGQWMAMETYNDERMRNVVPSLCLRMDLNSVNATRLNSESTATEMSIGFKTYKKALFDLDNPSQKGQWAARLVNGDGDVTEEHENLWLLAADPSLYFTQVWCFRDPETSILQVKDLITWRRINQTLSEQNIVDLRNAVKSSLKTSDLEALNFNSSC
ncbi:hypothetical protein B566_EDAN006137 [Ephemera danica]|nr:hypothetical protein B566_EDAN006137 [Ephemera danica]